MTQDPQTIQVYDERAEEYASVTANHIETPLLHEFILALPAGAEVLDLGCGPGLFAQALHERGLHVDATDASAEMVALANRQPDVTARQASFADLNDQEKYDGVWANFSLLHAPRAEMPGHLARIHAALKPGGAFHMTVKTGTGDSRDRLGRYYTYYQPDEMRSLLETAGFTVTKITPGRDKGLDGSLSDWISVASYA
jgi:2-polyprenyl-3-methyl-5-hydroxy-6-metoxy-1,4-benzoquinol methylase